LPPLFFRFPSRSLLSPKPVPPSSVLISYGLYFYYFPFYLHPPRCSPFLLSSWFVGLVCWYDDQVTTSPSPKGAFFTLSFSSFGCDRSFRHFSAHQSHRFCFPLHRAPVRFITPCLRGFARSLKRSLDTCDRGCSCCIRSQLMSCHAFVFARADLSSFSFSRFFVMMLLWIFHESSPPSVLLFTYGSFTLHPSIRFCLFVVG
jgi:hypothetical protein